MDQPFIEIRRDDWVPAAGTLGGLLLSRDNGWCWRWRLRALRDLAQRDALWWAATLAMPIGEISQRDRSFIEHEWEQVADGR